MENVYKSIDRLVSYAQKQLDLDRKDVDYVRNGIFRLLNLQSYAPDYQIEEPTDVAPDALLAEFTAACVDAKLFEIEEGEYYRDAVMGELSLLPSQLQSKFEKAKTTKQATEWLYNYCVKNDYVKKSKLDQNPRFEVGGLIVTINKAKPEFRDPKKAASGNAVAGGYPKCSICHENEGFAGRSKRTLRTVELKLGGKPWFWQFSPYGYFYQHGIAVNYSHTPMHVAEDTFVNLLDFVDRFPHYFIGSNAALPRIGGSVLAHDHYQGGGEILPMHKAKALYTLKNKAYRGVTFEIVDWPGSVYRVVSKKRKPIQEICNAINQKWISYDNAELGIVSKDEEGIHSAISPTVVKTKRGYEVSMILRNNITTERYPDGVFHAHPEFHIIKKESIGLIEAQGLFILPGRLEAQLGEIEKLIVENKPLTAEYQEFDMIYGEMKALCNGDYSAARVHAAVQEELGSVCSRILENTAVFKDKEQMIDFVKDLGFEL